MKKFEQRTFNFDHHGRMINSLSIDNWLDLHRDNGKIIKDWKISQVREGVILCVVEFGDGKK